MQEWNYCKFVLLQMCFFCLALLSHRGQKENSELWESVLQSRFHTGVSQLTPAAFQARLVRQGGSGAATAGQPLLWDKAGVWCHCRGIWFPKFPRQVPKPSWAQAKAAPSKGIKEWHSLTSEVIPPPPQILWMDLITIFLLTSWVDFTHSEWNLKFHSQVAFSPLSLS